MYPLNMTNAAAGGYAVASNEAEHVALSAVGYEPKHVAAEHVDVLDQVRAQLDAAGIAYDKRMGVAKLKALLPE